MHTHMHRCFVELRTFWHALHMNQECNFILSTRFLSYHEVFSLLVLGCTCAASSRSQHAWPPGLLTLRSSLHLSLGSPRRLGVETRRRRTCLFDLILHAYMHTCTHAHNAHMHTCIHAYMHTCVHAYMRTCIHAYMRTFLQVSLRFDPRHGHALLDRRQVHPLRRLYLLLHPMGV